MKCTFITKLIFVFFLIFSENIGAQEVNRYDKNLCLSLLSCVDLNPHNAAKFSLEKDEVPIKNRFLRICKICAENDAIDGIINCVMKSYLELNLSDFEKEEKDRVSFLNDLQTDLNLNLITPAQGFKKFKDFIEYLETIEGFGHESPKAVRSIKDHWGKQNPSCPMCDENGRLPSNRVICNLDKNRNPIFCPGFMIPPNPRHFQN